MTTDPLQELLERLAGGHLRTLAELAAELDITSDLLAQMIQDLVRAGYLRALDSPCEGKCNRCPIEGTCCKLLHGGRGWMMTDKALRAVQETYST